MIKPPVTVSLPPHPSQYVGLLPSHKPPTRSAFQAEKGEGAAPRGRRLQTHSEGPVSSPICPDRGGAARVAQCAETQASSYSCSF